MGSGTTAIACIKEKRNFLGSEIDKKYYSVLSKRILNEQSQTTLF
jgi:DNA modification methylase